MATTINSNTTDGLVITPDTSGEIKLQSAGADIATVSSSGITMASGKVLAPTGPAFAAYLPSPQLSITSSAWTKVQISAEDFDTASCFDTVNHKFTPNVAGYYQVNAKILLAGGAFTHGIAGLYKNGTRFSEGSYITSSSGEVGSVVNDIVYCNGTTDYLELFGTAVISSGSVGFYGNSAAQTRFSASLVRAA